MGLADTLYSLGIPYNSEEGFQFMNKVAEFFAYHSIKASMNLAKERVPFPLFDKSFYTEGKLPFDAFNHENLWTMDWKSLSDEVRNAGIRNSHTLTIAPTGSISMIVDVSSGLEPQFALVFQKHVTLGSFYYTDPELESRLQLIGGLHDGVLKKISDNGGSLQGLESYDDDQIMRQLENLTKVFLVAYDIPWWDHIRAQHEMQKWISASVSKTINMPSWASIEDVERAYIFAYKLGLKGVTIYRDGSKSEQVLSTPSQRENRYVSPSSNRTLQMMQELGVEPPTSQRTVPKVGVETKLAPEATTRGVDPMEIARSLGRIAKCPLCGSSNIVMQEACTKCLDCGWSTCTVA